MSEECSALEVPLFIVFGIATIILSEGIQV